MTKIMQDPLPTKRVHNLIIVAEDAAMPVGSFFKEEN